MTKKIIEKTKYLPSYKYDLETNTFMTLKGGGSVSILNSLVEIINILSENKIQFIIDEHYNIHVNIIDTEPQKAFVVSLDNNANIIDINEVALELSGYTKEELIGKNYFNYFIDKEDKQEIEKVFLDVLSGSNNFWKYQNNIVLKNGSKKFLHWSNALIKDKNNDISTIHAFGVLSS